ncbi:hypothetical protein BN7_5311 [Wickerhamomyces ciferrii]|uniref:Subtelomeric hrmA-associated cluster protein AFUB-079030/YDR124W-like helical bundle domain-containing protein n=1 Tax=Wickerhamomyces ciferrii (strain ATCC 14091 / BCRC 22168 / CBS 111 / JCM 3599 / NBRC 0793 / NRRL Y-1031 F-60-10) TaxID=1206466 RepID=K0KKJ6_WICCF|nr:uncharacterized protein BN7_5311 [Wickerhamomyces ciferrii]CCH45725.1 hypothetical protein BN7_5311 [Wickerhamomyces ciferrii]
MDQESRILEPLTNFVEEGGNFALLLNYPNGMIKFHSSDAFNSYIDVFRRELNPNSSTPIPNPDQHQQQHQQQQSSTSRSDQFLNTLNRALEEPTFELHLSSETELHNHLRTCFRELQQLSCKAIAKAWIKTIEPKKQTRYPYNKGESTKPPWWPSKIRHCEPDHLIKSERIDLLVSISRNSEKSLQKLKESTNRISSLNEYKLKILDEIYFVVGKFSQNSNDSIIVSDFENGIRSHKKKLFKPNPKNQLIDQSFFSNNNSINEEDDDSETSGSITPNQLSLIPNPPADHHQQNPNFLSSPIQTNHEFTKFISENSTSTTHPEQFLNGYPINLNFQSQESGTSGTSQDNDEQFSQGNSIVSDFFKLKNFNKSIETKFLKDREYQKGEYMIDHENPYIRV